MKLLFLKNIELTNGIKTFSFNRMGIYNLPEAYALELIKQGYACEFGFMSEIEVKK